MYNDIIIEYGKSPPNKQIPENYDICYSEENRQCTDTITVYLKINRKRYITDFGFTGETSVITTACASIFGESILDKHINEVGGLDYEYIRELIEMDISPRRKLAAVFGLLATRNALHVYKNEIIRDDFSDVLME